MAYRIPQGQHQKHLQRQVLARNYLDAGLSAADAFKAARGDEKALNRHRSSTLATEEKERQKIAELTDSFFDQVGQQSDQKGPFSDYYSGMEGLTAEMALAANARLSAKKKAAAKGADIVDLGSRRKATAGNGQTHVEVLPAPAAIPAE